MHATERPSMSERMLGFGGLLLALAGAAWIILLSEAVTDDGPGPHFAIAMALIVPLLLSAILLLVPSMRDNSVIWLLTGAWCGFLAALTIWSVGIIFLIATIFLLAAFLNANWDD